MSKNNELAVITNEMDVTDIIASLDAQLKKMDKIKSTVFRTSGNISPEFPNIKEEKNNENLIKALSVVRTRAKAYNEAAEEANNPGDADNPQYGLALGNYPLFKLNGHSLEDWHHDISTRYAINNQEETQQKITKYRNELKEFISKEERKANLVKDIIKDFGSTKGLNA